MFLKIQMQRKWSSALKSAALIALTSLPLLASASSATLFTVDGMDPQAFSFSGSLGGTVNGSINQVDLNAVDELDIILSDGLVDFDTQDVFVVEISLDAGSAPVDFLSFSAGAFPGILGLQGAGTLAGAGQTPTSADADTVAFAAKFDFGSGTAPPNAAHLEQNETTVRLFSTYAAGSLADGDNASFMISSGAGDTSFNISIVVPEPSTAILAMIGLAGLGVGARRSRV